MAGSTEWMATGLAIDGYRYCYSRIVPLISYQVQNFNPQVMCGSLDQIAERIAPGIQLHGWRILMMPHPGELDRLLPMIGTSESDDVFTPIDTLPEFPVAVRLKSSTINVWTTTGCKVDKAIFRAQLGQNPLMLQLDIAGKASTPDGSTFTPSSISTDAPYEWTATDTAVAIGGSARPCRSMVFAYDNHVMRRFNNSVTADVLQNVMRTIHWGFDTPYTDDEDDLLTTAVGANRTDGIAGSVTFTRGTKSFQIAVPKMVWNGAKPPSVLSKEQDIRMDQFYLAIKGADPICAFTNVLSS